MRRFLTSMTLLAALGTASAAHARPALWAFIGSTDRSVDQCVQILFEACNREYRGCERLDTAVRYADDRHSVWMPCHRGIRSTVFSVSGSTDGGDGDRLKQIIQYMKDYVDRNM